MSAERSIWTRQLSSVAVSEIRFVGRKATLLDFLRYLQQAFFPSSRGERATAAMHARNASLFRQELRTLLALLLIHKDARTIVYTGNDSSEALIVNAVVQGLIEIVASPQHVYAESNAVRVYLLCTLVLRQFVVVCGVQLRDRILQFLAEVLKQANKIGMRSVRCMFLMEMLSVAHTTKDASVALLFYSLSSEQQPLYRAIKDIPVDPNCWYTLRFAHHASEHIDPLFIDVESNVGVYDPTGVLLPRPYDAANSGPCSLLHRVPDAMSRSHVCHVVALSQTLASVVVDGVDGVMGGAPIPRSTLDTLLSAIVLQLQAFRSYATSSLARHTSYGLTKQQCSHALAQAVFSTAVQAAIPLLHQYASATSDASGDSEDDAKANETLAPIRSSIVSDVTSLYHLLLRSARRCARGDAPQAFARAPLGVVPGAAQAALPEFDDDAAVLQRCVRGTVNTDEGAVDGVAVVPAGWSAWDGHASHRNSTATAGEEIVPHYDPSLVLDCISLFLHHVECDDNVVYYLELFLQCHGNWRWWFHYATFPTLFLCFLESHALLLVERCPSFFTDCIPHLMVAYALLCHSTDALNTVTQVLPSLLSTETLVELLLRIVHMPLSVLILNGEVHLEFPVVQDGEKHHAPQAYSPRSSLHRTASRSTRDGSDKESHNETPSTSGKNGAGEFLRGLVALNGKLTATFLRHHADTAFWEGIGNCLAGEEGEHVCTFDAARLALVQRHCTLLLKRSLDTVVRDARVPRYGTDPVMEQLILVLLSVLCYASQVDRVAHYILPVETRVVLFEALESLTAAFPTCVLYTLPGMEHIPRPTDAGTGTAASPPYDVRLRAVWNTLLTDRRASGRLALKQLATTALAASVIASEQAQADAVEQMVRRRQQHSCSASSSSSLTKVHRRTQIIGRVLLRLFDCVQDEAYESLWLLQASLRGLLTEREEEDTVTASAFVATPLRAPASESSPPRQDCATASPVHATHASLAASISSSPLRPSTSGYQEDPHALVTGILRSPSVRWSGGATAAGGVTLPSASSPRPLQKSASHAHLHALFSGSLRPSASVASKRSLETAISSHAPSPVPRGGRTTRGMTSMSMRRPPLRWTPQKPRSKVQLSSIFSLLTYVHTCMWCLSLLAVQLPAARLDQCIVFLHTVQKHLVQEMQNVSPVLARAGEYRWLEASFLASNRILLNIFCSSEGDVLEMRSYLADAIALVHGENDDA